MSVQGAPTLQGRKNIQQRDDRRLEAERQTAVDLGKQRIEQRRLQGGSRFNIRFDAAPVLADLTPEAIMKALSRYVEFPDQKTESREPASS